MMERKRALKTASSSLVLFCLIIFSIHAQTTESSVGIIDHYCQDSICNADETALSCPLDCKIDMGKTTNLSTQLISANTTILGNDSDVLRMWITGTGDQNLTIQTRLQENNPANTSNQDADAFGKYLVVEANETVSMSDARIQIYYSDSDVSRFDESTLYLAYFNETNSSWVPLSGGVSMADNYVWGTTTHFSIFGIFGTLLHITNSQSSSSGGGHATRSIIIDETVEKPQGAILSTPIDVSVFQERKELLSIYLKNTLNHKVDVKSAIDGDVRAFTSIDDSSFTLAANESRSVYILVSPTKENVPKTYQGNIETHIGSYLASIPLIVKVKSPEENNLGVKVTPLSDAPLKPGDMVPVAIDLFDIAGENSVNAYVTLQLIDMANSKTIQELKDTMKLQANANFIRTLKIPENAEGKYRINIIVHYSNEYIDKVATAHSDITIGKTITSQMASIALPVFLLVLILSGLFSRMPLEIKSESGVLTLRNKNLFGRKFSTLMVVSQNAVAVDKAGIIINDKLTEVKRFNGDVREFFKAALHSGPIFVQYGTKIIYAIKKEDASFITINPKSQVKIISLGISHTNSRAYSMTKEKGQNLQNELNAWNILENKHITDPIDYFAELMSALKYTKIEGSQNLRQYVKSIISILQ